MCKLLIFGGTTEGRRLAGFCAENGIEADISVTTDYGASLLPEGMKCYTGRLDCEAMERLIFREGYDIVVDATHPYAEEASKNISAACEAANVRCYRLLRDRSDVYGETVGSIGQMVEMLNKCDEVILSTLGSNSAAALTAVKGFQHRIWLRILPIDGMRERCAALGYVPSKVICDKGPFTVEENISHITKSGAGILITKESGRVGGYPEKIQAAKSCGIRVITLVRPDEDGLCYDEITKLIMGKNTFAPKGEA